MFEPAFPSLEFVVIRLKNNGYQYHTNCPRCGQSQDVCEFEIIQNEKYLIRVDYSYDDPLYDRFLVFDDDFSYCKHCKIIFDWLSFEDNIVAEEEHIHIED